MVLPTTEIIEPNKCNRKDELVQVPDKFVLLVYNKRKEENEVC